MTNLNDFLNNYKLSGTKIPIIKFPHPVLAKKAVDVVDFNDELKDLAAKMIFTMYQAPGIGLAAPQIGKSIRMFTADVNFERQEIELPDGTEDYVLTNLHPEAYVNPVIIKKDGEIIYEEGCLSVPGIFEEVTRANHVEMEYFNLNGEKKTIIAEGTLAVCLQHELDHLNGIIFVDRLSLIKKNIIKKKLIKKSQK